MFFASFNLSFSFYYPCFFSLFLCFLFPFLLLLFPLSPLPRLTPHPLIFFHPFLLGTFLFKQTPPTHAPLPFPRISRPHSPPKTFPHCTVLLSSLLPFTLLFSSRRLALCSPSPFQLFLLLSPYWLNLSIPLTVLIPLILFSHSPFPSDILILLPRPNFWPPSPDTSNTSASTATFSSFPFFYH